MTRPLIVLLAFLLVGCADITAPREWIELERDARFFRLWSEVEECSGLTRNPLEVRWYIAPARSLDSIGGRYIDRLSSFVIDERFVDSDMLVRHEILHAILRIPDHPREYFVDRCGSIVMNW